MKHVGNALFLLNNVHSVYVGCHKPLDVKKRHFKQ